MCTDGLTGDSRDGVIKGVDAEQLGKLQKNVRDVVR
jgi:hypothetical protein